MNDGYLHRNKMKHLILLILVAWLSLAAIACSQEGSSRPSLNLEQIEPILNRMDETRETLNRTRSVVKYESYRSLQNVRSSGLQIQWTFSSSSDEPCFLVVGVPVLEGAADERLVNEALHGENVIGRVAYLSNPRYAAIVETRKSGNKLVELYHGESWKLAVSDAYTGLYSALPMKKPLRELISHKGTEIVEFTSQGDDGFASLRLAIDLAQGETGFGDPYRGIWEGRIDAARGLIMSQVATEEGSGQDSVKNSFECKLDEEGNAEEFTARMQFGGNVENVIEERWRILDAESDHDLPESACYLSHYGLPEPPERKAPGSYRTQPWLYYFFGGVLLVAIGAFLVHRVTRKSGRA